MRRAWKRFVGSAAAAALSGAAALVFPSSALAFHAGAMFDRPPGAGGGGGIFYTGCPLKDTGGTAGSATPKRRGK